MLTLIWRALLVSFGPEMRAIHLTQHSTTHPQRGNTERIRPKSTIEKSIRAGFKVLYAQQGKHTAELVSRVDGSTQLRVGPAVGQPGVLIWHVGHLVIPALFATHPARNSFPALALAAV